MENQKLLIAVCFICMMLFNSMASSRPLHTAIMKRQAGTRVTDWDNTVFGQIYTETDRTLFNISVKLRSIIKHCTSNPNGNFCLHNVILAKCKNCKSGSYWNKDLLSHSSKFVMIN